MHRFTEDRRLKVARYTHAYAFDSSKPGTDIRAAQRGDTLEVLLYGVVGQDFDGRAIDQEIANSDAKELKVRINSPGGDAWEGVAIYNLLRSLQMPVSVLIDGQAASAASVIAMAGKPIVMSRASMMMIHEPWTFALGNAREYRSLADRLEALSDEMAAIYARRSGQDLAAVTEWMREEEEMYGLVAVGRGFADAIIDDDESSDTDKAQSAIDRARELFAEPG